ncbi:MAG: glycosyltransferase family 2 protein [Actinobacteria bacterium]|nr:glycosyltransferase family 2 protein [Actinomycetota bacterium]
MSMSPRVSVVIPTHNRPDLLKVAVDSVLAQGMDGVEIVVVDDGSDPPAKVAVDGVTLVRQDAPAGPSAARNQGVAVASAPVIAFLDDDDRFLPNKLARCLGCFEQWPEAVAVIHSSAYSPPPRPSRGDARLEHDPQRLMLHQQPPSPAGVVVRRDAHLRVLFDESFRGAEDLDYLIRLAASGPFVVVDEVLSEIGQSGDEVSAISLQSRIDARIRLGQKHGHLFDREARSFYFLRLGHLHRRAGHRSASLAAFAKSAWLRPARLSAWKGLAAAVAPSTVVERQIRRRS